MKVLLISTSDRKGGAAIACLRLFNALKKNGTDVKMLVRDKLTNIEDIYTVNTNIFKKAINKMAFLAERLEIFFALRFRRKNLFRVSTGRFGVFNLQSHPLVQEADVINIHWTHQGMVSLKTINALLQQGKRIVFTMHDMYYFTGICHYAKNCDNFMRQCGNCFYLNNGGNEEDLSRKFFTKKLDIPNRDALKFVACSNWLADISRQSGLMQNNEIYSIPNTIDTSIYRPKDKDEAKNHFGIKDKKVILCGAFNFSDGRKGYKYLIEALFWIHENKPQYDNQISILIFGKGNITPFKRLPYEIHEAGYISDGAGLATLYSAGDVFVSPSLEDNLPNTIMESLACGTPCAAFAVGGIPQMIDEGVNGRLAPVKDSVALAEAVAKILFEDDAIKLSQGARHKVEAEFSEPVVAMRYNEIYRRF